MLKNGTKFKVLKDDLCLNVPFVKGQDHQINNCWHFSTDGESVETMFYDDTDFKDGMNRVYVVSQSFNVDILSFALMDTHVHFALHGEFDECNRFIHEYVRRTSIAIENRHHIYKALETIKISHQFIDTDKYLKNVICYIAKNPVAAGLAFSFYDYPWSSAPLFFRRNDYWAKPSFFIESEINEYSQVNDLRNILKTRQVSSGTKVRIIDGIVYPGEYVLIDIVERLFKTPKSFFYFLSHTREDDIESRGGDISRLSLPISEMRHHRDELCLQLFGKKGIRDLDTASRLKLARILRSKYNSSIKQIARVCGLVISEAERILS